MQSLVFQPVSNRDIHFEPFVQVADLSATTAMIAWGGFFFRRKNGPQQGEWQLLHDHEFERHDLQRSHSIGAKSEPYGHARVTLFDGSGTAVAVAETSDRNFVQFDGLQPDTLYRYEIDIDGALLISAPHREWRKPNGPGENGTLVRSRKRYIQEFQTFPDSDANDPVNLAVIGDYGVGIHRNNADAHHQARIAAALTKAVDEQSIRLVVTAGDNIYRDESRKNGTGAEDDDWYFAFYQPYRHVISRVPFFPCIGNHDTGDTETADDRDQLNDNFYLTERWKHRPGGRSLPVRPALFYSLGVGKNIQLTCVDSSWNEADEQHYLGHPRFREFVRQSLQQANEDCWNLVFCHHPPFCAGPRYANDETWASVLLPLLQNHSGCVVVSGHEHNFQHNLADGIHYFISGSGGKVRERKPKYFTDARTQAWASEAHFLKLEISSKQILATPMTLGRFGELAPLSVLNPQGKLQALPINIGGHCTSSPKLLPDEQLGSVQHG